MRELEPHFGTLLYIRMVVLFLVLLLAEGCTEDDRGPPSVAKYLEREKSAMFVLTRRMYFTANIDQLF